MDAFDEVDPARILVKTKLHIVAHAPEDALRFGPLVINATEGFESYNSVFRRTSVLSNRQAPSRDIAVKFADMDRIKHILSGGYWKEGISWVQAGPGVQSLLAQKSILQSHLGWTPLETEPAGASIKIFLICSPPTLRREDCSTFRREATAPKMDWLYCINKLQ